MDIVTLQSTEKQFNLPSLHQQRLDGSHDEALVSNGSPMNEANDAGVSNPSGNQDQGSLDPQPSLPGGLHCGGANFYSVEFAEKLFRSLPFMISQPKARFLTSWQTDTQILPQLGVPVDVPVKRELEEVESDQLRFIQNQLRRAMRPERVRRVKSDEAQVYRCEQCPETFSRRRQLRHHVGLVHLQLFNCPKCSRVFSSPTNAKRHSLNCQGVKEKPDNLDQTPRADRALPKKWQCLICKKKLTTVPHIYRHFKTLHPNEDPKASTASIGGEDPVKEEPVELDDDDLSKERRRQRCQCNICGKTATRYFRTGSQDILLIKDPVV